MISHLSPDDLLYIKAATRRLISLCGGVEAAQRVTRVNKTSLGNYQNPEILDSFMPADVVADLEAEVQQTPVTTALAELAGATLSRIQMPNTKGDLAVWLGLVGKEFGDVFERAPGLLSNPKTTARERQNFLREIEEAIGSLVALKACVVEEGKKGQVDE